MDIQEEKLHLLKSIATLKRQEVTGDLLDRLLNLYACLEGLNWQEVDRRMKNEPRRTK